MKLLRLVGISKRIDRRVVLWVQEKWDPCWHGAKSRKIRVRTARKAERRLAPTEESRREEWVSRLLLRGRKYGRQFIGALNFIYVYINIHSSSFVWEKKNSSSLQFQKISYKINVCCHSLPLLLQSYAYTVVSSRLLRSLLTLLPFLLNKIESIESYWSPPPPDFLLGGTAFNGVVEELKNITTRVAHVLPVSDDGGSTAEIVRVLGNYSSVITSIVNAFGWSLIFFYLGMKLIIIYKFSDSKHCVQVENITSKNIFIF